MSKKNIWVTKQLKFTYQAGEVTHEWVERPLTAKQVRSKIATENGRKNKGVKRKSRVFWESVFQEMANRGLILNFEQVFRFCRYLEDQSTPEFGRLCKTAKVLRQREPERKIVLYIGAKNYSYGRTSMTNLIRKVRKTTS